MDVLRGDVSVLKTETKAQRKDVNVLKDDVHGIKLLLENDVCPRLSNIESCYADTYDKFAVAVTEIESLRTDVDYNERRAR